MMSCSLQLAGSRLCDELTKLASFLKLDPLFDI